MLDIKEFTENKEKINGVYLEALSKIDFLPEQKTLFLSTVQEVFDSKVNNFQGNPFDLYREIIERVYYETLRTRHKLIQKNNKKVIQNRGNIIWDSRRGTYRNEH